MRNKADVRQDVECERMADQPACAVHCASSDLLEFVLRLGCGEILRIHLVAEVCAAAVTLPVTLALNEREERKQEEARKVRRKRNRMLNRPVIARIRVLLFQTSQQNSCEQRRHVI